MSGAEKIALVTGANKGIGFEAARQLTGRGFRVFLGARNEKAGGTAAQKIGAMFLKIDVSDQRSIREAAKELAKAVDHLDVLVNNAGIIVDGDDAILKATPEQFEETMRTNALGPLLVAKAFQRLLAKSSAPRIVNVSSSGGQLHDGADGWSPIYCISKTTLNGVTSQLAAALPKFAVNSVCPGWVRTDMGGAGAPRSVEQGADGIVWLAVDAPQNLTGKFVQDRKVIPW
ncbi:MAG TPA: SDR family NAD(P)-dependent oxidoreductase [Chthoniobacterales bacterium]|nr:SDR family NAD(P)-dependent oxidoreductase [Chthoniobacterales bacterium]